MTKYRLVKQLDEWGCGVACVASLLGISYTKAKDTLIEIKGKEIDRWRFGLSLRQISKAVPSHKAIYKKARNVTRWPVGAIVFLSEESGRYAGSGHYILKTPDGWMDPQGQFRQRLPSGTTVQAALVPNAS